MRRLFVMLALLLDALWPLSSISAQCPENPLSNPGFEGEWYAGSLAGTGVSSYIARDWLPWAVLGDPDQEEPGYNHEPEYKILQRSVLQDGWYRVYAGERAQAFFSMFSTHTAGFYQRVAVPEGAEIRFSIWVQIYTGQEDLSVDGRYPISDLVQPLSEPTRAVRGPGDYRVSVGIDPFGGTPAGFGEPIPLDIVWSDPVLDVETRGQDSAGQAIDEWVRLEVTTVAQADHVTVYTRGQPTYRTRHNDSYWDEACLQVASASPETSAATFQPVNSASIAVLGSSTALPPTPRPTATPSPAVLQAPSTTPRPPITPLVPARATTGAYPGPLLPTGTPTSRVVPTLRTAEAAPALRVSTPVATQPEVRRRSKVGLALLYALNIGAIAAVLWWIWRRPRI